MNIIYDLDATLIETPKEFIHDVMNKCITEIGDKEITMKKALDWWFDNDKKKSIHNICSDAEKFWELIDIYDSAQERMKVARCYGDILMLEYLEEKGHRFGIVTSSPPDIALEEIKLLPIDISNVVLPSKDLKSKPAPDGILKCMKEMDALSENTMYVGNGIEDVLAAKNARVVDVLIKRPECPPVNVEPSYSIDNLYQLREVIRNVSS
jgi:HAD superfamily hydrolase (TIGR01549 family)